MSKRIFRVVALSFLGLLWATSAFATTSQLSFTTDSQVVGPGEISAPLTIQLQDASGASTPATETMDVVFTSSSPTGEFLSPSSENPVTKTISTGSANKNFRYRDTTEGTVTITAQATGRTSGLSFSATQGIIISSATSTSSTATTTEESTSTSTTSPSSTSSHPASSSSSSSAHFSYAPLSSTQPAPSLELSAGRPRIAAPGSPLEFKAETNLSYTKSTEFTWNFGDGSQARGEDVVHTYAYPGTLPLSSMPRYRAEWQSPGPRYASSNRRS